MSTLKFQAQVDLLHTSELQFRLASAVRLATSMEIQPLDLPVVWTHGKHRVSYREIALRQDQGDFAAWCLQRTATYMLAMAVKDAIRTAVADPKNSSNAEVRAAYQIARLIRNAFAHSPFDPVWSIDGDCLGQVFAVRKIVRFDTTNLHGQTFDWRHYGGPLALFRLSRFVRKEFLGEKPTPRRPFPPPTTEYFQQGSLILMRVGEPLS